MDSSQQQKQVDVGVMEAQEIHGDLLLMELLDASLAAENAGHQQLGSVTDVDGDVDCWIDDSQESYDIHAHQDCEDCGLDGGGMLPDFDEYGGSRSRLWSPAAPYAVFDHDDTLEWAETTDAAMDPFASACSTGDDWYMDGLVMVAMEWEEQQDAGSGFPSELPCYGDGGEAGAEAEQVYASPLWE